MTGTAALPDVTLVDILHSRAKRCGHDLAFVFLPDGDAPGPSLTYGELEVGARRLAATLGAFPSGSRLVLAYPPGLEFVVAFYAALSARAIPVPMPMPRGPAGTEQLRRVCADAEAGAILTSGPVGAPTAPELAAASLPVVKTTIAGEADLPSTAGRAANGHLRPPDGVAYLQYTSGSTGRPKGVVVSHANVQHNVTSLVQQRSLGPADVGVTWAPHFHDMGLVLGCLLPVHVGFPSWLLPPLAFVQRPARWLWAISRSGATISAAPNFAYELCVARIDPADAVSLDLSRWAHALNGAERVRPDTLEAFATAFRAAGFRRNALAPGYGLAESTLIATLSQPGSDPVVRTVDRAELERGRAVPSGEGTFAQRLVGCGTPPFGTIVTIADPLTRAALEPGRIGEICIGGPSVAQGYWNRPDETRAAFGPSPAERLLRTGDLGFLLDGELFVTGRLKDLLIIRGENHYPEDLEQTVESAHPAIRRGCCAAVAVEVNGGERLAMFAEVGSDGYELEAAIRHAIRTALATQHGIAADEIVLLRPRTLPRTTSGKLMRHALRTPRVEVDDGSVDHAD